MRIEKVTEFCKLAQKFTYFWFSTIEKFVYLFLSPSQEFQVSSNGPDPRPTDFSAVFFWLYLNQISPLISFTHVKP